MFNINIWRYYCSFAIKKAAYTYFLIEETEKEKKRQEDMAEELKNLVNVNLICHVKELIKKTFMKRKQDIDASESIKTVLDKFPFLSRTDMMRSMYCFYLIYLFIGYLLQFTR